MEIVWDEPKRERNLRESARSIDGWSSSSFPRLARKPSLLSACGGPDAAKGGSMSMSDRKRPASLEISDEEEAEIQAEIAADPENPEWTDEDFARARPFPEVFPELMESINRSRGRPKLDAPKKLVTLRLDQDVIEKFRATGRGWQSRINEVLKHAKV
jgi:uncharacterized protein (DUF4415 family)